MSEEAKKAREDLANASKNRFKTVWSGFEGLPVEDTEEYNEFAVVPGGFVLRTSMRHGQGSTPHFNMVFIPDPVQAAANAAMSGLGAMGGSLLDRVLSKQPGEK